MRFQIGNESYRNIEESLSFRTPVMTELKHHAPSSRLRSPAPAGISGDLHGQTSDRDMTTTTVSQLAQETGEDSKRAYAWKIAPTLFASFKYAWMGVRYAFLTQRNFRIHTIIGTLALLLGAFLRVSTVEMAAIALTTALVMALELINTAIESVVDLVVQRTYSELAKIAKDCAAGAVLVAAVAAVLVASFILLPPLLERLSAWL